MEIEGEDNNKPLESSISTPIILGLTRNLGIYENNKKLHMIFGIMICYFIGFIILLL
jgi:hypothetical protein